MLENLTWRKLFVGLCPVIGTFFDLGFFIVYQGKWAAFRGWNGRRYGVEIMPQAVQINEICACRV